MRKPLIAICLLCSAIVFSCSDDDPVRNDADPIEIDIAALLSVSGSIADVGQSVEAALELAREDINQQLADEVLLNPITVYNSNSEPDSAARQMANIKAAGVDVVVGPVTSAEVTEAKPFADENSMLLLSPSSVSQTLSIAGDNVFRFLPDDALQAEAMTAMIADDGIEALVTVNRSDVWGIDLAETVLELNKEAGRDNVGLFPYATDTEDFANVLTLMAAAVENAVEEHGADKVGVYLLAFTEAEIILSQAANISILGDVRWYGVSALSQNPTVIANAEAAAFASKVGFPCPNFGLDDNNESVWKPVQDRLATKLGREPEIFAMAAYDIAWVVVRTFLAESSHDVETLKASLPGVAANYNGVTGNTTLNAAGDRAGGNYAFWSIVDVGGSFEWRRTAIYNSSTQELTRD